MIIVESHIAKKYASAFLNVYEKKCDDSCMKALLNFSNFLHINHMYLATLNIPSLSIEKKKSIIDSVSKKLLLPESIKTLTLLLLKDKRVDLLDEVLKKIIFLHKQRVSEHSFVVSSSHDLTSEEKESVITFIKSQISNSVKTSFTIDKSLISGIKIEGNTFRWERSIAKELRNIEQKLSRQEEL